MWYNDLLLVLMGVIAIVMILMAVMIGSRAKKPLKKVEEEPKPEKILVEKGFENNIHDEPVEPEPEPEPDYSDYMEPETPEYEEPPIEETTEPEPEPDYSEYMAPEYEETIELEPIQEEPEPIPEEPIFEEPEPLPDETVEITPIEPIIIEFTPETEQPDIYGSPSLEEPDDDVIITPNQTFYDPVIEEPSVEPEPEVIEEETPETTEPELPDIPEIELPAIEKEPQEQVPEEIEPDTEEEPEELIIPEETLVAQPRNRIRKPIRDESDPEINMDLGVETCPHCGSKVPNTIYCINCGKALDPNYIPEPEEE